jgi:hypothetical protein
MAHKLEDCPPLFPDVTEFPVCHCIKIGYGFNGFCRLCYRLRAALLCCHCLTLHVSAYMTIFRCVAYFYFHIPEGLCFAGFLSFLARGYTLHVSSCVFLFCFSSLILLFLGCVFVCFNLPSNGYQRLFPGGGSC